MLSLAKPTTVIVDSRESRAEASALLMSIEHLTCVQSELQVGDYCSTDLKSLGVERKTANDLVLSIMDRRVFGQVELLSGQFEKAVLLIIGDPYSVRSEMTSVAMDGFLSWVATLTNTSLMMVGSERQAAALIARMAFHAEHGLGYDVSYRHSKPKEELFWARYAAEGLPGVGPTTAKNLIDHFGSVAALFQASESQLKMVKGVGPKMASAIVQAINTRVN